MATVYEVKSGDALNCEPVDARELIASGFYQAEPKKAKTVKTKEPKKAVVAE